MMCLKHFFSLWWVAMAFFICTMFSGVHTSLSVFIDDVSIDLHMTTAVIGITLATYVVPFGISGPIVSYALNVVGCRPVIMMGGVVLSAGIFIMAFARHIAFIWIGYSLLGGIGGSAIYTASTATIRQYYSDRHYALANGAAITGVSMSVFVFSPVLRVLASYYGWRGALVIASAISLNTVVIGALIKPEVIRKRRPVVSDDCKVSNLNHDNDEDDVKNGTHELLLRKTFSDQQPTSCLESSETKDLGSSVGAAENRSESSDTEECYPSSTGIPAHGDDRLCDSDKDIDENKELVEGLVVLDRHVDVKSGISMTKDNICSRSNVSGEDNLSSCQDCTGSQTGVNDIPNEYHNLENAKVVRSTFRISNLCKFSAKPISRTTSICHAALLVAIFFLSGTYMTCSIFLAPAGTHGGLSPMQAATLLSAVGISQAVGRFSNGIIVMKGYVKTTHLYIGAQILMASSSLVLGLLIRVYAVAVLASLTLGVSAGTIVSLNIVMQRVIDDCANSISLGWLLLVEGFGGLFGSLALGYLKDVTGSFLLTFVLAAVFSSLSAALSVFILILKRREATTLKKGKPRTKAI
ncbi:monocarboxylate transporter 13-like isoform X2 [Lytechinus variegatus]|uniref:monocarboxylate transporter 13-like isoform X2 n=1 Tax=Lytechinus variegatus TaxID=7654 RepID=UPI001BB0E96F|nr:monocarboxylate transporter 13-like isoform X2 [Lytechinus variegatus]